MQGSSTPYSTWTIHDTRRVVSLSYGVSAATSHIKSSMFFVSFSIPEIFFFLFVFRVSFMYYHVTHLILHSYRRRRRTYIHAYLPWDVVHSTLGHCSFGFVFIRIYNIYPYLYSIHIALLLYSVHISIPPLSLFHPCLYFIYIPHHYTQPTTVPTRLSFNFIVCSVFRLEVLRFSTLSELHA